MALLSNVKLRLGIDALDTSKDSLINLQVSDAEALFKESTKRSDVPAEAANLIERLAVILYLRNNSNFVQGETLGDHSVTNFASNQDLPESIHGELRSYKKLVVI